MGRTDSYYDDSDPVAARPNRSPLYDSGGGGGGTVPWDNDEDWDGTFSFKMGKETIDIPSPSSLFTPLNGADKIASLSIAPKLTFKYIIDIHPFGHSILKK